MLLPVVLGDSLQRFAPRLSAAVLPVAPLTAVVVITLIVASISSSFHSLIGSALAGFWRRP